MPRALQPETQALLERRELVTRDFIWFTVRDRASGLPVSEGFWSDVGTINADVIEPLSGATVTRTFVGSGTLIEVDAVTLVNNLTTQEVSITLAQVHDRVQELMRTYDANKGAVEIYRGLYNPDTMKQVEAAEIRFFGIIDTAKITTPSENNEGGVELTCVDHTQELIRYNTDTRSDASQRQRNATDNFYQDTSSVGDWEYFWGQQKGKVATQKPQKSGLAALWDHWF